jgi:hypothetical protein
MMKIEGFNGLKFPFELASPSFSEGPGLQGDIFHSLTPGGTNSLCTTPRKSNKYDEHFLDVFVHPSFLLS